MKFLIFAIVGTLVYGAESTAYAGQPCNGVQYAVDPTKCTSYLQCVDGNLMSRPCGAGTGWNPKINDCDFIDQSVCATAGHNNQNAGSTQGNNPNNHQGNGQQNQGQSPQRPYQSPAPYQPYQNPAQYQPYQGQGQNQQYTPYNPYNNPPEIVQIYNNYNGDTIGNDDGNVENTTNNNSVNVHNEDNTTNTENTTNENETVDNKTNTYTGYNAPKTGHRAHRH